MTRKQGSVSKVCTQGASHRPFLRSESDELHRDPEIAKLISVFANGGKTGHYIVQQLGRNLTLRFRVKLAFFAKASISSLRILIASSKGMSAEDLIIMYVRNQSGESRAHAGNSRIQPRGGPRPLPPKRL